MNRRAPCVRTGLEARFIPGMFEVLDHDDIIEVLARSKIISAPSNRLIDRRGKCLAIVLLDTALICSAVVSVDDVPEAFDDDTIAAVAQLLAKLPSEISAIAFAICSPSDPPVDSNDVERLATLCEPLAALGVEVRDIVECYPSGFSSLRADLIEHEAQRW